MFAQPASATNQGIISQCTVTSFHAYTCKGTVSKTGATETCDLFCNIAKKRSSWIAMLRVLLPTNQTRRPKIRLRKARGPPGRKVVAKIESSSTFHNKICTCYAFSQPTTNLFCNYSCVSQHLFFKMNSCWNHATPYFLSLRYTEWWKVASCFWEPFRRKEGSAYEAAKVRLRMPQVLHNYSFCVL